MKKNVKLLTCGTAAFLVATLGLNAQPAGSSTSSAASPSGATGTSATGSAATNPSSSIGTAATASPTGSVPAPAATRPGTGLNSTNAPASASTNASTSGTLGTTSSGSMSSSGSISTTPGIHTGTTTTSPFPSITFPAPGTTSATGQAGTQVGSQTQTSTPIFGSPANTSPAATSQASTGGSVVSSSSSQTETQVTTLVQQLDRQGPAVIQRISSQLGDLACSQDTVQNLVDALHDGKSVTLTSNINGQAQSATFNPTGRRLGYGEAFIALSLAAEQLRNAGVTGCATPDQWEAVLLGGPLAVNQTSSGTNSFASASSSTTVPGILTLRNQGQGWGQIARSANVQLGQIVSNASVSGFSSVNALDPNAAGAPTGQSSADFNRNRANTPGSDSTTIHHDQGQRQGQQKDEWLGNRNHDGKSGDKPRGKSTPDGSAMDPSHEPATDTGTADSTPGTAQPSR